MLSSSVGLVLNLAFSAQFSHHHHYHHHHSKTLVQLLFFVDTFLRLFCGLSFEILPPRSSCAGGCGGIGLVAVGVTKGTRTND